MEPVTNMRIEEEFQFQVLAAASMEIAVVCVVW
jgi:hypothetical protein